MSSRRRQERARYQAAGCPSYWVVDPDALALTVWELTNGEYVDTAHATGDEQVTVTASYSLTLSPSRLLD